MNELELGTVIKSRALLTEQLGGGMREKRLEGREKGCEKFLSPFLSGQRCAIERSGKSAGSSLYQVCRCHACSLLLSLH